MKLNLLHFAGLVIIPMVTGCIGNADTSRASMTPPVFAPFQKLDTISTNDWWNRKPNKIIDVKVKRKNVVAFGIYTWRVRDSTELGRILHG